MPRPRPSSPAISATGALLQADARYDGAIAGGRATDGVVQVADLFFERGAPARSGGISGDDTGQGPSGRAAVDDGRAYHRSPEARELYEFLDPMETNEAVLGPHTAPVLSSGKPRFRFLGIGTVAMSHVRGGESATKATRRISERASNGSLTTGTCRRVIPSAQAITPTRAAPQAPDGTGRTNRSWTLKVP